MVMCSALLPSFCCSGNETNHPLTIDPVKTFPRVEHSNGWKTRC
jgi:hypothetical protein